MRPRSTTGAAAISPRADRAPVRRYRAVFEYRGSSALTVYGASTGARYHFARPGARLVVALADRRSLERLPSLREIE